MFSLWLNWENWLKESYNIFIKEPPQCEYTLILLTHIDQSFIYF